jgi:hypothetical protein
MMNSLHYKTAYNNILNQMPKWKQLAIKEDTKRNNMSGILTEFLAKVIETAEKEFENQSLMNEQLKKMESKGIINKKTFNESTETKKKSPSTKLKNKEK